MAKVYLIASGKGGVGKTTVAANLGIIYALNGFNTVLIDADIGLNNLDVTLGIERKIIYDIVDVLEGRINLENSLVKVDGFHNLRLLASSKVCSQERIRTVDFCALVEEASKISDVVLIDAPAGIEMGFHRAASACQEAIIVTTPHISAIKDADKVISLLSTYGLKGIGVVVNRVRKDLLNKGEILDPDSIVELLRCPLYGVIPESDRIGVYYTLDVKRKDKTYFAYEELKKNLSKGTVIKSPPKSSFLRRLFK